MEEVRRKVKRFYFVHKPHGSDVIHMSFSHIESPTLCGRHTEPGWAFWFKPPQWSRVCKQCLKSHMQDDSIMVQRVRRRHA